MYVLPLQLLRDILIWLDAYTIIGTGYGNGEVALQIRWLDKSSDADFDDVSDEE